MSNPLVSIIIPTYNRAHLLEETLNSIVSQSYVNWECLVIDDGSKDDTDKFMESFIKKDQRFQYHKRPKNKLKGGNAARNYGFQLSKGVFIQWFDSDDKMEPDFLALKVDKFLTEEVDLVISKSKYFGVEDPYFYAYNYKAADINFLSYATDYIAWKTDDFMVRRSVVESITFNEFLKAGQEYNFCCNLLLETSKIAFINQFLTLRRFHVGSKGVERRADKLKDLQLSFHVYWETYIEVHERANQPEFNKFCLLKCILSFYESKNQITLPKQFHWHVKQVFGMTYNYFLIGTITNKLFGKYHYFYNLLKRSMV
jgi:glycosyltransferase involved in cell wall biosynthesis